VSVLASRVDRLMLDGLSQVLASGVPNRLPAGGLRPDLKFVLDLPPKIRSKRKAIE
jgi:hypothetical protein